MLDAGVAPSMADMLGALIEGGGAVRAAPRMAVAAYVAALGQRPRSGHRAGAPGDRCWPAAPARAELTAVVTGAPVIALFYAECWDEGTEPARRCRGRGSRCCRGLLIPGLGPAILVAIRRRRSHGAEAAARRPPGRSGTVRRPSTVRWRRSGADVDAWGSGARSTRLRASSSPSQAISRAAPDRWRASPRAAAPVLLHSGRLDEAVGRLRGGRRGCQPGRWRSAPATYRGDSDAALASALGHPTRASGWVRRAGAGSLLRRTRALGVALRAGLVAGGQTRVRRCS